MGLRPKSLNGLAGLGVVLGSVLIAASARAQNVAPVSCLVGGSAGAEGINPGGYTTTVAGPFGFVPTNATFFALSLGADGNSSTPHGGASGPAIVTASGQIAAPAITTPGQQGGGGLVIPQSGAIWAESIGGCGYGNDSGAGKGGDAGSVSAALMPGSVVELGPNVAGIYAFSAGGQGAGYSHNSDHYTNTGGNGGDVSISLGGTIRSVAASPNAYGIYALSVGGASGATDNKDSAHGGNAGDVTVNLLSGSSISLTGDGGVGVLAMSAGGLSWYADNGTSNGHQNGNGGNVAVVSQPGASISTSGELAVGILAASTGGNANTNQAPPDSLENGGSPNAVPSDLAPPGNAGTVSVTNGGTIATIGNVAIGIAAVSSTGGRGVGLLEQQSNGSYEIDQVGQVGPGTGAPGMVAVANAGRISTNGVGASGILALSLGGSGGVMDSKPGLLNLLGGHTAGTGANGNAVAVADGGTITTQGAASMGILAESVGGGGGTATGTSGIFAIGTNGGTGGNGGGVSVAKLEGSIQTSGDGSFGILAHSIGGGGGNGANATGVIASIGGAGGASGNGGGVTVSLGDLGAFSITTQGDYAPGVGAQSVGGGGGNGGDSKGISVTVFSAAVGGSGGAGGDGGGIVIAGTDGLVSTAGFHAPALLAQSIGGGGGTGGSANIYSEGISFAVNTAIGGNGGKGGQGGSVFVSGSENLATTGDDSAALLAQSVGGGGGTGGSALARTQAIGIPDIPTVSISTAVGGSGGSGGNGGVVTVESGGMVTTTGDGSTGIFAQSVGGGGGSGGDSSALAGALATGDVGTVKVGVSVGGDGKGGGSGGTVDVVNDGAVGTAGANAAAILAQSVGGGGGIGGVGNAKATDSATASEDQPTVTVTLALGGTGGIGGVGGDVFVGNTAGATIATTGSGAQGILAQSVGGGGGDAGGGVVSGSGANVTMDVGLGGSGGSGANGGTVTVLNGGNIRTGAVLADNGGSYVSGGDAVGILAQSIGGGGGVGGSSDIAATFTPQSSGADGGSQSSYQGQVILGGTGSGGSNGGAVNVSTSGSITTLGARAHGILAQSIGGGGGSGAAATGGASGSSYAATVALGGGGGGGGDGGSVSVSGGGSILTAGYGAVGILAQSIGGGGGYGAEGTMNNTTTIGLGVDWNGKGGAGGNGGAVAVDSGALTTLGDDAAGVLAQSVGGGGGAGSAGCSNSAGAGIGTASASLCLGNTLGIAGSINAWNDETDLTLTVGGGPGASGAGGPVQLSLEGAIQTAGARSIGAVAQSIGGGGGYVSAAAANIGSATLAGTPGANNGSGGGVGVTLNNGGSITTSGAGAWGILAQSISGGGGFAGDPSQTIVNLVSNSLTTSDKPNGSAGNVSVTSWGDIRTSGAEAHGIVAQSVGGGGGIETDTALGGLAFGNSAQIAGTSAGKYTTTGGAITIDQESGLIETTGTGSVGILAQSTGTVSSASKNETPVINVSIGGTVIGGTLRGYTAGQGPAGIMLSGGGYAKGGTPVSRNTVTVGSSGFVGTVDGANGTAIMTEDGWTDIVNSGTILGNILQNGSGTVSNSGRLYTGSTITTSQVTNNGILNVAGPTAVGTTTILGNYTQTASGELAVDINALAAQTADLLTVQGNADVAGVVQPLALTLLPGTYTVLQADALTFGSATVQSSLLFNWQLSGAGSNGFAITPYADFTPAGVTLNATESSLANYLANGWNNNDAQLSPIFGYLSQIGGSANDYRAVLNSLSPAATHALSTALIDGASAILGASLSCPVFVDKATLLGEDQCVWSKVSGNWTNIDRTSGGGSDAVSTVTYRLGGQKRLAEGWYFGGSLGLSQSWQSAEDGSSGQGTTFDGSLALKRVIGPWYFAGAFAVANGGFQNNRWLALPATGTQPAVNANLTSNTDTLLVGSRLRAGYEFSFPRWYLRPYVDADILYSHTPGYQESGSSVYALQVSSNSQMTFIATPALEAGSRFNLDPRTVLRAYGSFGAAIRSNDSRTVSASFVGSSAADGSFDTQLGSPRVIGTGTLGLALYRTGGFEARAEYELGAGSGFLSQGGTLRLAYHF